MSPAAFLETGYVFRIAQKETYTWPVVVELPADGGKFQRHAFDVEFRRAPKAETDRILHEAAEGALTDEQLVARLVVGWSGVEDVDGEPLPFSQENLARLLGCYYQVPRAIARAWIDSLGTARQKN